MASLHLGLVLYCLYFTSVVFTNGQGGPTNPCIEQKTCGACIAAGPQCGWCTQPNYDIGNRKRCDEVTKLKSSGCDPSYVYANQTQVEYTKNEDPANAEGDKDAIQLAPQEMKLKLRAKEPYKFTVQFRQAENYPVDLYYVMDLSYSMLDDKKKLADLGEDLAESMTNITKNVQLGFGSFIDKKTMPYVSTVPDSLKSPCEGCAAPYGFKNQLRLTERLAEFREKVLAANISGNLDAPEGGFDAMMQAIVCKNDIGWRDNSRKMLLFSTDAGFHFAGDGQLGGIVKPNDGHCHLDSAGFYSESLNQDYPSISQISNKVLDENVNVIFAVTSNQFEVYKKLSKFVKGSVVGVLADDSSNVVQLVRSNYEKISGTVELKAKGTGDGVYVGFRTSCTGDEMRNVSKCDNVKIGDSFSYEVTLEVTECPADRKEWHKEVSIQPVGLAEALTINLDIMCECECELPEFDEENSPKCNGSGTYECGACTCNEGFYGDQCECDPSTLTASDNDAACKMTNTSEVCEGNGECICSSCDCFPITVNDPTRKYRGDFCECNDYSCDYYEGEICGGPKRGRCNCGVCACQPGYVGDACECPISEETCRAANGKICNGMGRCECGKCLCAREEKYRGPTCEDCPTCPGKCEANKACVQCKAFKTGEIEDENECTANCSHVTVLPHVDDDREGWRLCKARDDADGCYFYFIYEYNSDKVEAQKEKECPTPVNILAIILGVIFAILLIGLLLLLLWKIVVTLYDRREYAKFEKEVEKAKWDMAENPIFKPATSTYTNPMK